MSNSKENTNTGPQDSESAGTVSHVVTEAGPRVGSFYMEGWIKLHRKVRDNWIWRDPVKFQWWIDILLEVNHTGKKVPLGFEIIECKRGESIRSLHGWASRWGVSKDTARNFIRMLEKDNMIECVSLQKSTRITVCNYDIYQADLHVEKPKSKRQANDNRPQTDPNKNDKNEDNEKNLLGWDADQELYMKLKNKYPKLFKLKYPLKYSEHISLIKDYTPEEVRDIYSEMQNYIKLEVKSESANLTARNWLNRNKKRSENVR